MQNTPSLFARKLRDWRLTSGTHGRLTQEQLADRLGVSVEAVGKYERSLSFIRGDLEHRLAENLGWTRSEILACRADWQARQQGGTAGGYRLLDAALSETLFGGDWAAIGRAGTDLAKRAFGPLPPELSVCDDTLVPVYEAFPDHWGLVLKEDQLVGKWAVFFLTPEDEALFRSGRIVETDLTIDRFHRPLLPGTYFGYCPVLIVLPGHEAAATLLLSSFVQFLENLAAREVFLHGLGTISCTKGGEQLCRDLGMTRLCDYFVSPEYGVWTLPGEAIARSIFTRRSPRLAALYADMFPPAP
jgi:transcriptional regulator with XRE-family HTH domain